MVLTSQRKYFFILSIVLITLDQLSKYLIVSLMDYGQSITIIDGLLNATYVHNTGVAFSLLAEYEFSRYLLPIISIIASIGISIWMLKPHGAVRMLSLSLILAGAFGNFIDRSLFGYVIDFIHFYHELGGTEYHFAIFNVADSCITLGVLMFLFSKDVKSHN